MIRVCLLRTRSTPNTQGLVLHSKWCITFYYYGRALYTFRFCTHTRSLRLPVFLPFTYILFFPSYCIIFVFRAYVYTMDMFLILLGFQWIWDGIPQLVSTVPLRSTTVVLRWACCLTFLFSFLERVFCSLLSLRARFVRKPQITIIDAYLLRDLP